MTNRPNKEHAANAIESDPIRRILSSEEQILPSSGFLASVMERVQEESRVPAPIPFPWKRALPVMVVGGIALLLTLWVFVTGVLRMSRHVAVSLPSLAWLYSASPTINVAMSAIGWTAAALALALASVIFSFRLTGRRV